MFCLMSDDMELYKQFTDNPTLKKWLSDMVFRMIYNSSEKLLQSWSILFSSAELLTACPCLDQFSDEDWRRLNILPKLRGRLHTSDQFRKLIELTRYPYRHHKFDDDLSL